MHTRGGAGQINGVALGHGSGFMPLSASGSGGAELGILTPGIKDGTLAGAQTQGATGATGTAANAPDALTSTAIQVGLIISVTRVGTPEPARR